MKESKIESIKGEETLREKVEKLVETGGDLEHGGQTSFKLHYPEEEDEKTSPIGVVEYSKKIAYTGGAGRGKGGISCYQGLEFFNGNKLIEIKPVNMWRDGEDAGKNEPENFWQVKEFVDNKDGSHKLVIGNSTQDIEIYRLKKDDVSLQKKMSEVEYKEKKEDKTPEEKFDLLKTKLREITLKSNPRGGGGTWDSFYLDTDTNTLKEFKDSFFERREFKSQLKELFQHNYPLIFNVAESLKGKAVKFEVFVADPKTLKLKGIFRQYADKERLDDLKVKAANIDEKDKKKKTKRIQIIYTRDMLRNPEDKNFFTVDF
jgi:hypothetical protein